MYGRHCLKSWSVTQTVISLSSEEAEYYAMVKGGLVAMGFKSLLDDFARMPKFYNVIIDFAIFFSSSFRRCGCRGVEFGMFESLRSS